MTRARTRRAPVISGREGRRRAAGLARELAGLLAPPPALTVSAWADRFRQLSPESCPEPGQWYTSKVPYLAAIMDAFTDPAVERVVVMSSAQVGKTECILNVIGYHMHYDPCPIMVVQPTGKMLAAFSRERLSPMVRDTPVLTALVKDNKLKDSGNTLEAKAFPGGHLAMVSAESDASLQGRPRRLVLFDEVDRYTNRRAIGHGQRRAARYWRRKFGLWSTPENKAGSIIEPEYLAGTRERWELPCPACGAYQPLLFTAQFCRETAEYACKFCGVFSGEYAWKAGAGRWTGERPMGANKTRSFHLSALVSPGLHWPEIALEEQKAEQAQAEGDPELSRLFTTQIMGEAYEEHGEELQAGAFDRHRHFYGCEVPAGVLVLTAAVDTQDDRLEVDIRGWGRGLEQWGIRYLVIPGHPDEAEVVAQLDALLLQVWAAADGRQLSIARMVIDSGGHYTDAVYGYTRPREGRGVYAVHGSRLVKDPLVGRVTKQLRKGLETPTFALGVNQGKDQIFHRLQVKDVGPGFVHWPMEAVLADGVTPRGYDAKYFGQLTNEKRVKRLEGGTVVDRWVPKRHGVAVEAWDLLVYNLAAMQILGGAAVLEALAPAVTPSASSSAFPAGGRGRRVLSAGVG